MKKIITAFALSSALLLVGCGQSGPLYLQVKTPAPKQTSANPALKHTNPAQTNKTSVTTNKPTSTSSSITQAVTNS
jgi:predicted small lipoprotein YifL